MSVEGMGTVAQGGGGAGIPLDGCSGGGGGGIMLRFCCFLGLFLPDLGGTVLGRCGANIGAGSCMREIASTAPRKYASKAICRYFGSFA